MDPRWRPRLLTALGLISTFQLNPTGLLTFVKADDCLEHGLALFPELLLHCSLNCSCIPLHVYQPLKYLDALSRELALLDVVQCLQLRERLARVKRLEGSIAQAAGIAMVFSSADTTMSAQYLRLLEALAAAVADAGPLKEGGLMDLPLRVQPRGESAARDADRASAEDSEWEGFKVDVVSGLVSVPVDASAAHVLQYLKVMMTSYRCPPFHLYLVEDLQINTTSTVSSLQFTQLADLWALVPPLSAKVCKDVHNMSGQVGESQHRRCGASSQYLWTEAFAALMLYLEGQVLKPSSSDSKTSGPHNAADWCRQMATEL